MRKNGQLAKKRADFVKKCVNNPLEGAKELHEKANGMENCRTTEDIYFALNEILYLSERTIDRDVKS